MDYFALAVSVLLGLAFFLLVRASILRHEWLRAAGYPQTSGLGGVPFIGSAVEFGINPLAFLIKMKRTYGDVFLVDVLATRFHFALGPHYVNMFYKQPIEELDFLAGSYDVMPEMIGPHMENGAMHGVHPLILKGFSQRERLDAGYNLIIEESDKAFVEWEKAGSVDIFSACSRLVVLTFLRFILGDEAYHRHGVNLAEMYEELEACIVNPMVVMFRDRIPYNPPYARMMELRSKLLSMFMVECEERIKADRPRDLSILQFVIDECGTKYPVEAYGYFAVGIMMAARTNTAGVMAWTLAHLAADQNRLERVRVELESAHCSTVDPSIYAHSTQKYPVEKLTFLDACMKETVRSYSNLLMFRRVMKKEGFEIAPGKVVPHGELLCISPAEMHHDPKYFEDPFEFKPERWCDQDPEYFSSRNKEMSFNMWGFLRHRCYGEKFAVMFDKVVWARLLSRYDLSIAPDEPKRAPPLPDWKPFGTSFPKNGDSFRVRITPKKA